MTEPIKRKGRQLFAVPMRRYTVFLDAETAAFYKARGGGKGKRSEGMRLVARAAMEAVPGAGEPTEPL